MCGWVYIWMCVYAYTYPLYKETDLFIYTYFIYMCVYVCIYVCIYIHIHTRWCPRGFTQFPRNASTAMEWKVSKDHTLNLKFLLSHSPSQLWEVGWASLNQTKSTFQKLPVQNNKLLGCYKLYLEQSPHIPYGENRRLEWDWEELGISLWKFGEKRGDGRWLPFERAFSQFGGNLFWNSRVKLVSG